MSKLVPNCVGRLDDIVDHIRIEEYDVAQTLLAQESDRVEKCVDLAYKEYLRQKTRLIDLEMFQGKFLSYDFRQACTKEVGG